MIAWLKYVLIKIQINLTACVAAGKTRGTKDAMHVHLINGRAGRKCQNASDEAVNVALSIKFPGEEISVIAGAKHVRPSSGLPNSDQPRKKLKQPEISPHVKGLDIPDLQSARRSLSLFGNSVCGPILPSGISHSSEYQSEESRERRTSSCSFTFHLRLNYLATRWYFISALDVAQVT